MSGRDASRDSPLLSGLSIALLIGGLLVALWGWGQVMFLAASGAYEGKIALYGRCTEGLRVIGSCLERESERSIFALASGDVAATLGGLAAAAIGLFLAGRTAPGLLRRMDRSMTWRFVAALQVPNLLMWLVLSNPSIELPASGGILVVLIHAAVLGLAAWRWRAAWRREGSASPWPGLGWRLIFYPSLCLSLGGLTAGFVVTVGGSLENGMAFWQDLGGFFLASFMISIVSGLFLIRTAIQRREVHTAPA